MRDAFGGLFMSQLMLVFIFIFVSFTAVSLNYAKAFRIKNSIISYLEEKEVTDLGTFYSQGSGENLNGINRILENADYRKTCNNGNGTIADDDTGEVIGFCYNGIEVEKMKVERNNIYYNVYTYADWNLGSLNMLHRLYSSGTNNTSVQGRWKIKGTAKVKKR